MDKWTKAQIKLIDNYIRKLTALYKDEYKAVLDEIKAMVLELYAKIYSEGEPLLSHLYQYKRYRKLIIEIQDKLTQLGVKQEEIFTREMENFYEKNIAILDDKFERPFNDHLELFKKALLDDKLWQESIWKDKAILLNKVKHELIMNLSAGKTVDQMAEALKAETLTGNFYDAKRLVRTEVVKYYVNTTKERYKEAGVTEVEFHAAMDGRTCEQCSARNHKKYKLDSSNLPPCHPNCRCWVTPVL